MSNSKKKSEWQPKYMTLEFICLITLILIGCLCYDHYECRAHINRTSTTHGYEIILCSTIFYMAFTKMLAIRKKYKTAIIFSHIVFITFCIHLYYARTWHAIAMFGICIYIVLQTTAHIGIKINELSKEEKDNEDQLESKNKE